MRSSKPSSSPVVIARAHALRASTNAPEQMLWALLRGKQLGVWFRRQVPLGRFVADFAAPAAGLVVEIDGGYHASRRAADGQRDRALARNARAAPSGSGGRPRTRNRGLLQLAAGVARHEAGVTAVQRGRERQQRERAEQQRRAPRPEPVPEGVDHRGQRAGRLRGIR